MRHKRWLLVLVISLAVVLLASSVGVTWGSFVDLESSSGNTFQAWASRQWVQTTQADFNAGVLSNVDTSSSSGDVKLSCYNWYNANWQYRRQITIDHTKVENVADPSTTYANFPVLVYATGLSNIKASGADIRFTSADGTTELPREIESYSAGTLYAWIKVTLTKDSSDSSNDVIYMYYGNSAATEPAPDSTYGSQNVWDSYYKLVTHMRDDPDNQHLKDSTSGGNNLTKGASGAAPTVTTQGKIADAQTFDGTNDYAATGTNPWSDCTYHTITAWVKTDNTGTYDHFGVLSNTSSTSPYGGLSLFINKASGGIEKYWSGAWRTSTTQVVTHGQWCFVALTGYKNGTNGYWKVSVNGGAWETVISGNTNNLGIPYNINAQTGRSRTVDHFLKGVIDELRVTTDTERSLAYIKTEYNNQNSPAALCGIGSEENYNLTGTIASQVWDTGVAGARWDALFWDKTLETGTNITFEVRAANTLVGGFPDASWIPVGGISPVSSGLPSGRYKQWRATLTTSDTSKTPTLREVRVYHY